MSPNQLKKQKRQRNEQGAIYTAPFQFNSSFPLGNMLGDEIVHIIENAMA